MNTEQYGIIVKRNKQENYGFPMDLKMIDNLTTTYSQRQLMEQLKNSNIIPYLDVLHDTLSIAKNRQGKWIEDKTTPLITDSLILNYDFKQFIQANKTNFPNYARTIYSNLYYLLGKSYINEELKHAILSLKALPDTFLQVYENLNYHDQRLFRYLFYQQSEIEKNLMGKNPNLQRKKDED